MDNAEKSAKRRNEVKIAFILSEVNLRIFANRQQKTRKKVSYSRVVCGSGDGVVHRATQRSVKLYLKKTKKKQPLNKMASKLLIFGA